MSETQTSKLLSQQTRRQNSATLFKVLDEAVNSAFESFLLEVEVESQRNSKAVLDLLASNLRREVNKIQIETPSGIRIKVLPSSDRFEEFFYLKAWIMSRDFEGDTICITRFIGFNSENPRREEN